MQVFLHRCKIRVGTCAIICFFFNSNSGGGGRGSVVVKALCCKPEGRVQVPMRLSFLNWPNPSGRTMALGSTQPLTEMSTRNL
jgi:hypothetical protein